MLEPVTFLFLPGQSSRKTCLGLHPFYCYHPFVSSIRHQNPSPGSAICVQYISCQNTFYNPAAPTMLGTINWMLWREDGYQVASVCMHVYSPREYNFQDEYVSFIAIPIYFIDTTLLLTQSPYNSLGQTILDDMVVPPYRVWEPAGYTLQRFELGEMLIEDRSEAIRNWVDEQARFGWF